ncbi:hypothetical protein ABES17_14755 [Bacillus safensis]|uniref:hypothetical protein n=1 Tax=Bacillus safensis TaxID=561879 RepID=UPI0022826C5B|nr:hypothetical protein [Bacillus safensis]MCY7510060.1 hypothetical protein [Bacillus safensis]MCY7515960.1 hypothetical protein [Bacillus safensis]MED4707127.1 hypothetical protein [Bacillus safensis]
MIKSHIHDSDQHSSLKGILADEGYVLKKFRGKKRYFRNMWEEVNTCDLKLDRDSWFYFWHTHLDFFGVGKNSLKKEESIALKSHTKLGFVFTNMTLV